MITSYGSKLDRTINKSFKDSVKFKPKELVEQLILDPAVSGIDLMVTYSTALKGITQEVRNIKNAIINKHENVKVIILMDDSRNDMAIEGTNVFKRPISRNMNADDVKYAVEQVMSAVITDDADTYSSEEELETDFQDIISQNEISEEIDDLDEKIDLLKPVQRLVDEYTEVAAETNDNIPSKENSENNAFDLSNLDEDFVFTYGESVNADVAVEEAEKVIDDSIEKSILEDDYRTLEDIENDIDKDKIYRNLLQTNTEFYNTNEALNILDVQLKAVFYDREKSNHEKLIAMQEIVNNRAILKGKSNSIFVDTLSNIIDNIINITVLHVDDEIKKMKQKFANISEKQLYKGNTEVVSKLSQERCNLQTQMANNLVKIVNLYDHLSSTVLDSQNSFIEGIPSTNPYINSFLKPAIGIAPLNLTENVECLFKALNEGKIKLSAVEAEIKALLDTSSKLCDLSDHMIAAQSELIETMKAQKFEDVVVVDSLLKNCLRLYAGSENSGKTASAIVINEINRRKGNTLLIDLTRSNKAGNYIPVMENLLDVIEETNRGEHDLLYCRNLKKVELGTFIDYLQDCASHYRYINILTDYDQHIREFEKYALSISIFMQPTIQSINKAKDFIKAISIQNVAKRICVINPSVEPTEMFSILDISPAEYKYSSIPNMPEIIKSTLRKTNPGLNKEIRIIFEEQF